MDVGVDRPADLRWCVVHGQGVADYIARASRRDADADSLEKPRVPGPINIDTCMSSNALLDRLSGA